MNGKGDKRRLESKSGDFRKGYERIFGNHEDDSTIIEEELDWCGLMCKIEGPFYIVSKD